MELQITLGNSEITITNSIFSLIMVVILLTIFALYVNKKVKEVGKGGTPTKFLNIVEMGVEAIEDLVISTMGSRNKKFSPFIFTLLVLLAVSNLFGLLGFTTPTSDISVTLAFALVTFTMVQLLNIKTNGPLGYVKGFFQPYALLSPLNIIGELATPISLAFRLFGNILSGGLIMTLIYNALGYFAPLIAPPLHIYFDLFSGLLQAFIFTMLTMVFMAGATE